MSTPLSRHGEKMTNEQRLDFALKEFAPGIGPIFREKTLSNGSIIVSPQICKIAEEDRIHEPWMVFLVFVVIKKYKYYGRSEKIAWEIPVSYKNIELLLTHRKFGFEILYGSDSEDVDEQVILAYNKIKSVFNLASSLLQPYALSLFKENKFTIENTSQKIYNRYLFFKKQAKKAINYIDKSKNIKLTHVDWDEGKLVSEKQYISKQNAFYYSAAMVDAFFSYIENIFILLIPFIDVDCKIDIPVIIYQTWSEKIKLLFNLNDNVELKRLYEILLKIKEQFRNPITHGNFQKDDSNFQIHFPHLGAIPLELTNINKKLIFSFIKFNKNTFVEITKYFDAFEDYLKKNELTKFAYFYIVNQFPVFFDSKSRQTYHVKMVSWEKWNEYLDYLANSLDNAANMDW